VQTGVLGEANTSLLASPTTPSPRWR